MVVEIHIWGLLIEFFDTKYGPDSNGWDSNPIVNSETCVIWKCIIPLRRLFDLHIFLIINNGHRVSFRNDIRIGDSTLSSYFPRLYRIASHKNAFIYEILSYSPQDLSWNLALSRDLLDSKMDLITSLLDSLEYFCLSPSLINRSGL